MEFTKVTLKGRDYIDMYDIQDAFQYPNFSGKPNRFNSTTQSFSVEIPEDSVPFFKSEHVHINEHMQTGVDDPEIIYRITVYVSFAHPEWYPTEVHLADEDGSNDMVLSEDQAHLIDDIWAQAGFTGINVRVRKKKSSRNEGEYTLYLSKAYFRQATDEFDERNRFKGMPKPTGTDDKEEMPFV